MQEHTSRHIQEVQGSSNRTFGLVFAGFFMVVGLLPILHGGGLRIWSLILAGAFGMVALAAPALLAVPNRLWTKLGMVLHQVVSPVALGVLFFCVVTPTGFLLRLFGKDPLRLRREKESATYWVDRTPPGPDGQSMNNMF